MAKRRRREYLQLLDAAKAAAESAVDAFNRVRHPYRNETTLILLTNASELLAKAVLVQKKESIKKGQRGDTISAETFIRRIFETMLQADHYSLHPAYRVSSDAFASLGLNV